jgi:galactokinase
MTRPAGRSRAPRRARDGFARWFGRAADAVADAPGRVNLIGEHTDYNEGFVLPTAIPQRTYVGVARRGDDRVHGASAEVGREPLASGEYRLGHEAPGRGWLDYVQGLTAALVTDGHAIGGFDLWVESDVPIGSGLSSSAALEVGVLRAIREAFGLVLDDVTIARLGQRAENDFVGARVGIMDQMAASLADEGTALFIDTRSLDYRRVAIPSAADLVVIDSGVAHAHAGGDYNTRRAECEEAAARLGVHALRDLGLADLPRLEALPDPLGRRARHVVTENARVLAAVAALEAVDMPALARLFAESHVSMRDDYEVSVPEIDLLVALAREEADVLGARLTGGGFGGSVVMLARRGAGAAAARRLAARYAERSGRVPRVLVPAAPAGPGRR